MLKPFELLEALRLWGQAMLMAETIAGKKVVSFYCMTRSRETLLIFLGY